MNPSSLTATPPSVEIETFLDAFCRQQDCSTDDFPQRVFWRTVYRHVWPLALVVGVRAECFSADRALISYCGRLTSLGQIDAELTEFSSIRNHGYVRRHFRVRVSGRRLKKLAAQYLAP